LIHPLRRLSRSALAGLAEALRAGRVGPPFSRSTLAAYVPDRHLDLVRDALADLGSQGMTPRLLASTLELLAEERAAGQRMSDRVQLVWSPPELDLVDARDTAVVVQDLFRSAKHSVLIASYALDGGTKAQVLFGALASRMDAQPSLEVRVYANIHRNYLDETPASVIVRQFAVRLRDQVWPGERLPEVFYDPRSVEPHGQQRAVLHAKCVVVDERWTLLTSANFTEAAQERNIEAGVVIDDQPFAERMRQQFEGLVEAGTLRKLAM